MDACLLKCQNELQASSVLFVATAPDGIFQGKISFVASVVENILIRLSANI